MIKLLDKPVRITDQCWGVDTQPIVSVFCWSYNDSEFIRDSIESILEQETTFPVEIVIHDDASTDGTAEKIAAYQNEYPFLFRTILQSENQWSKGNGVMFPLCTAPRGKFIALTHGDDFWICKNKLQRQVDILEGNSDVSLVFHNAWLQHEDSRLDYFLNHNLDKTRFSLCDIIDRDWFMATASLVFRKNFPLPLPLLDYSMGGDMLLQIGACAQGDAVFLNDVCSVYRRHSGGISEECWKMGAFHFERMRPNHLWMFWLLKNEGFSDSVKQSLDRKVQSIIRLILGYAASVKGGNFLSRKDEMVGYIVNLLIENKPTFIGDDTLVAGSDLVRLVEGECQALLQTVPKPSRRSYVRQKLKSILRRLT